MASVFGQVFGSVYGDVFGPIVGIPLVQDKYLGFNGSATTRALTYDSATTLGNLLVSSIALDKSSGAITVPTGWTQIGTNETDKDVSGSFAWKLSDGTETDVTWNWTSGISNQTMWIAEYSGVDSLDVSAEANSNDVSVTSQTSGTTGTTTAQPSLAVGTWAADTANNVFNGQAFSNGFEALHPFENDVLVGLSVATKTLSTIEASVESTFATTDSGDQMWGKVGVFIASTPPIPNIAGNADFGTLDASASMAIEPVQTLAIDGNADFGTLSAAGSMAIVQPGLIEIAGNANFGTLDASADMAIVPVGPAQGIAGNADFGALDAAGSMGLVQPGLFPIAGNANIGTLNAEADLAIIPVQTLAIAGNSDFGTLNASADMAIVEAQKFPISALASFGKLNAVATMTGGQSVILKYQEFLRVAKVNRSLKVQNVIRSIKV